jgi:hypothetical protein
MPISKKEFTQKLATKMGTTEKETRVVGNIFNFELKAPVEIHKMLWNAGVSEKSSSGFGWSF